jgi:hypothetical protein
MTTKLTWIGSAANEISLCATCLPPARWPIRLRQEGGARELPIFSGSTVSGFKPADHKLAL